jgi:PAS domain S-box-containing protein
VDRGELASLLEATLEATADGILVVDRARRITLYNQRFLELWRVPEELLASSRDGAEALRWASRRVVDAERFAALVEELAAQPERESFDVVELRDGRVLERFSRPQRIGGEVVGRVWSFRDVTAARRAQERLEAREAQYRLLAESMGDVVTLHAADGAYLYVSPSRERVLGWTLEETLGATYGRFVHPDDLERVRGTLDRLAGGEPTVVVWRALCKDGSWKWLETTATPVVGDDGRLASIVASSRDVDARVRAEEALRASETRLRAAERLEAVGRLAGGVAHDFNNLLTAVGGYAEMLLERARRGERVAPAELERIRDAAERAANLTRRLLAFSRRQMLRPVPVDLAELVERAAPVLRVALGPGVELRLDLARKAPPVLADRAELERVLHDLAAHIALGLGGVGSVRIATRGERARVRLTLEDSGPGFDEETLARLFEPFFSPFGGDDELAGLGLAPAYGVLRQLDGDLAADRAPGGGTVYTLTLPAAVVPEVLQPGPPAPPSAAAHDATVLLVEDEELVRRLLEDVLQRAGFAVLTAASGAEALELAQSARIDVVVTDLAMPGMDGRELGERLRALHPDVPLAYMSGYAAGRTRERIDPAAPFLQKPFTPAQLVELVRSLLAA